MSLKLYTLDEVSKHNKLEDCWIIIDDKVLDVTKFLTLHPAGKKIILDQGGKDATEQFWYFHSPSVLAKYEKLIIGRVEKPKKPLGPLQLEGSSGEGIPYGDIPAFQKWNSPYYRKTHFEFRERVRAFYKKEVEPFAE